MARTTIIPGQHPINPDVDPAFTHRYRPATGVVRECDAIHRPSAYPQARRFETIYPGTREAQDAQRSAWLDQAREHDRNALASFADLLEDNEPTQDLPTPAPAHAPNHATASTPATPSPPETDQT